MLHRVMACLIAPLCVAAIAASAQAQPAKLVESGSLTYGTAASFIPFEFQKDGKITGFDIDMIDALAAKLSLAPKAMNMDFKGLIPALQGGRVDLINSAMYINPARAEQVEFVPYLKIGNQVLVQTGNPSKITGRDDTLCGKTIATTLGAIEETFARQDDKRCQAAGKPAVKVLTLPTAQDAYLTLRQGRADAAFDSTPGVVELTAAMPGAFEVVGPEFETSTQIGMAVRKGDADAKAMIEGALKQIVADGTYKTLIAKWKLPATVSLFD